MTRAKYPAAIEAEARLQKAIVAVQNRRYNVNSVSIVFKVPRKTLDDCVKGKTTSRQRAHKKDQLLNHMEEKELVRWITRLTTAGYGPRHSTVREMTNEITMRHVKKYDTPRSIETAKIRDCSPERLAQWFKDLEKVIADSGIQHCLSARDIGNIIGI
jgi:hypothetical protein